ncbi:MAG: c-type cytochrome [Alphaproteobacteria bacterium]|nr:c-type cytochrome [Alphaproteobacteria bacterium]
MKVHSVIHMFILMGVVLLRPGPAVAESPSVALMVANCGGCHGVDGRSPGSVPSLAGRPASELAALLMKFKTGARPSTIMGRIMTPFGDEEIRQLADYFSALPEIAPKTKKGK